MPSWEGATYETPPARTVLPNLERIINFAREQGMPSVWTQSGHRCPFGGVMLKKFPTIREDKYLWKGQPSFELYEQTRSSRCRFHHHLAAWPKLWVAPSFQPAVL